MCRARVQNFTSCTASVMIQRRRQQRAQLALMTQQSTPTMCVSTRSLLLLICARFFLLCYAFCAADSAQLTSIPVASPSASVCLRALAVGGLHLSSTCTVYPGSLDEAGSCYFAQRGRERLGRHGHKPGATVAAQRHHAAVLSGHALAERRP